MKANKSFKNEEDAVSPVIGVILMVAITVVLAAVVFVLVSDLGGDAEIASFPQVKLTDSATANGVDMEHRSGDCITIADYTFSFNTGTGDVTIVHSTSGNTEFCVGDTLTITRSGATGSTTVKVIDKDAQSVVFERSVVIS